MTALTTRFKNISLVLHVSDARKGYPWNKTKCLSGSAALPTRSIGNRFDDWIVDSFSGTISLRSDSLTTTPSQQPSFQVIVGLEIHAQLQIPTKLFSPARSPIAAGPSVPPNHQVHPFDVAVPGYLPRLSRSAVQKACLAAAALQCEIVSPVSRFERKHYAYADLPAGYQITQQRWPLARQGKVTYSVMNNCSSQGTKDKAKKHQPSVSQAFFLDDGDLAQRRTCRIDRIQLEQDTGKTTTTTTTTTNEIKASKDPKDLSSSSTTTTTWSRVDFQRAGAALLEIVTAPDLRSSLEASAMVRTVHQLLRSTGTCPGHMQQGQLRVDVNINLEPISLEAHLQQRDNSENQPKRIRTPRIEVKNLNSLEQVRDAIDYEARRQAALFYPPMITLNESESDIPEFEKSETATVHVVNQSWAGAAETRTWNVLTQETTLIRIKDSSEDYRFLPEPDIPPVVLSTALDGLSLEDFVRTHLPELPDAAYRRLQTDPSTQLSSYQASLLAMDPAAVRLFDRAMAVVKADLTSSSISSSTKTNTQQMAHIAVTVANFICNELTALVKEDHASNGLSTRNPLDGADEELGVTSLEGSVVTGEQLGELALMLSKEETVSRTMAKRLLVMLYREEPQGTSPRRVAQERQGFRLISDAATLQQICRQVVLDHAEELEVYRRGGKFVTKMLKLFTGKAMALSQGQAHPERLQEALAQVLHEMAPVVNR